MMDCHDMIELCEISISMKQGCVLTSVLFNIFTCRISHATQSLEEGIYIWYHLDGSLFDHHHLNVKTMTFQHLLHEAFFANDCVFMGNPTATDAWVILHVFKIVWSDNQFHQDLSALSTHTKHLHPGIAITLDATQLANIDTFKYMSSMVFKDGPLNKEIDIQIIKASQALRRLCKRVLGQPNIGPCQQNTSKHQQTPANFEEAWQK